MSSIIPKFEFVLTNGQPKARTLDAMLKWVRANFIEGQHGYIAFFKIKKNRTERQNRFFHGPVLNWFSSESGESVEKLKEFFKNEFGPKEAIFSMSGKTRYINKSSADWTTEECMQVIERIRVLGSEMGFGSMPDPEQVIIEGIDV